MIRSNCFAAGFENLSARSSYVWCCGGRMNPLGNLNIVMVACCKSCLQRFTRSIIMSASIREREHEDTEPDRSAKRTKVGDTVAEVDDTTMLVDNSRDSDVVGDSQSVLPPSHSLLGIPQPTSDGFTLRILERDVGISEYVGRDVPSFNGIIKQRYGSASRVLSKKQIHFSITGSQTSL